MMFLKQVVLFSTIIYCVKFSNSARILIVLPSPSLSHHLFFRPITAELSLRGHDVVAITPDPMNDKTLVNLTEIDVHEEMYKTLSVNKWLKDSRTKHNSQMQVLRSYAPQLAALNDGLLNAPQVKALIANPYEHFDLVIIEMQGYAAMFGFKERFNCPAIGISSLDVPIHAMDAIGNPPDPNYYVGLLVKSGSNLGIWERLGLLWHIIDYRWFYYYEYAPELEKIGKKHFNLSSQTVVDLERSVDLILANTHPVFHIPRPHVPNFIEIGGLHERKKKPLPDDLKTYLDNSTNGVVYFSLGSNMRSESLPENIRKSILKAFKKLPYNVIWKWESTVLADKPENVLIKPWLPQQDVLDHPNVKVFVTQGGLQSADEAIRSQVPMVGIPFGGDQEFNVNRFVELEIGRELQYADITTETLWESINDVAINPKYKNNIIKLSNYIRDKPMKSLDLTMWWIEYVIRHRGAKHLRCPAADLPVYKNLLLDILAFILGVIILGVALLVFFINFVLKKLFKSKIKFKKG